MTSWRIRRANAPMIGPVTTERVVRAIEAGRLPSDVEVQRIGQQTWTRITDIAEFEEAYMAASREPPVSLFDPMGPSSEPSEPPTAILEPASMAPTSERDEDATVVFHPTAAAQPGTVATAAVPRGLSALSRPPKRPQSAASARTTARAIPHAAASATPPLPAPPATQLAAAPAPNRPPPGRDAPGVGDGLEDERTRIMPPIVHSPVDDSQGHAHEGTHTAQHKKPPFPESSAVRAGRLPPRPVPFATTGRHEAAPPENAQLRDAVEDDDADEPRRPQSVERTARGRRTSSSPAGLAIAVGAHIPGGDRAGKAPGTSASPPAALPSVSLHPDHDRTSPALRALKQGPERYVRTLVIVIVILTILLCISTTLLVLR